MLPGYLGIQHPSDAPHLPLLTPTSDAIPPTQVESRLKELMPAMPILLFKSVMLEPSWEPTAVGYIRPAPPIKGYQNPKGSYLYNCPVYLTTKRGATYICLSTLKTIEPPEKWCLAGVALMMQTN